MNKNFKIGSLYGSYFTCRDPEAGEVFRNVAICRDDIDAGFTCVRAIITAGRDGRVEVAWDHESLTDGRITTASNDLEYELGHRWGFWKVVLDTARDLAAGRIPPECGELEIPGLPEFLNAEPDDMSAGLINMDTGGRISWGDLEQPDEILAAIARKAEESEKGGAE